MEKFKFYCPTEIIFGKDSELSTASLIKKYNGHNVLIVYGGGSVKRSGLLDKICQQLSNDNLSYMTLGGVQPNPIVCFVNDAVKKAYQANIDFVLAIGGGSVIDTAKAIAHGLKYPQNDIWDIWTKKITLTNTTPVVYNTSGYERVEILEMLKDYIDVFLPDFKYYSPDTAKEFSHAPDYPQVVKEAIDKMFALVGKPQFKDNIMQKGVIIRHLILPWYYKESMEIVKYIWEKYHDDVYLSLMNQYTPMYKALTHPKLKRKLTTFEYDKVVDYALDLGFKNCYIQQGKTATTKFVPHFDGTNVY